MTHRTLAAVGAAIVTLGHGHQVPAAQGRQAAPAAPQVVVGGVQVAKVAVPADDMFSRPFNGENGTKLLLWVRMPAGQGLLEIDDDASVLQHFGDDKGTDLGGRFGSFPSEFKDGSGGTVEIASTGMPSAAATRLMAEGTLALSVASGRKPQRVANVRIENGRTFTLGAATITVADVEVDGGNLKFTLKMPRAVMESIYEARFSDAKNQPVRSERAGGGYAGDNAEIGFVVTTPLRALTIEFDVWQGRRVVKVPFKVQAGIGLGG